MCFFIWSVFGEPIVTRLGLKCGLQKIYSELYSIVPELFSTKSGRYQYEVRQRAAC